LAPDVFDELTDRLAREIHQRTDDGPLIFEQEIADTATFHVIVVWQRWVDVPEELRNSIFLEAYTRSDPDFASKITIAVGVTMEEAIDMNLLPFQIITLRKEGDPVTIEQVRDAMQHEGGTYAAGGWQLRFPTRELAEEALARLRQILAGDWWRIEHHPER
jgi:hypothetical protein